MTASLRERHAALPPLPAVPRVSVIMAVRNESAHVDRALAAVRAQDWPAGSLEILVADGRSSDDTRERLLRAAAADARVRVLDNPERTVAPGLNLALAAATGDVIVRADGHCALPPGYVRAGVEALRAGVAECAGGPVRARGDAPLARAIAIAMSTPFGVGGASFRWASDAREVDHLPFGAWRREVFAWLGGFDAALVRNQDDELSDRLRRAGGRIRLLPEQEVTYWSRTTLAALARQYFGYGFWKVRVIRRRGGWPSSPRHVVPAAFLLALPAGALAAAVTGVAALAAAVPAAYAAYLALATAATVARTHDAAALLLPAVLPVMHAAYGAGFLAALFDRTPAPAPAAVDAPVASDARAA